MGRRALRKLNPNLDLSAHFKTPDEMPARWTSQALFGNDFPVDMEVGSGKGLFISNAAAVCPMHNFVGIEVSRKYARFSAAKLARASLPNAMLIHGDARTVIQQHVPADSVNAVHVYFPDPWWKKRHKKRRVLDPQFLRQVQRVLMPEGRIHFWTDVEEYFQTSLSLFSLHTSLVGPLDEGHGTSPFDTFDYRTHFERRTRQQDRIVYRAQFKK